MSLVRLHLGSSYEIVLPLFRFIPHFCILSCIASDGRDAAAIGFSLARFLTRGALYPSPETVFVCAFNKTEPAN